LPPTPCALCPGLPVYRRAYLHAVTEDLNRSSYGACAPTHDGEKARISPETYGNHGIPIKESAVREAIGIAAFGEGAELIYFPPPYYGPFSQQVELNFFHAGRFRICAYMTAGPFGEEPTTAATAVIAEVTVEAPVLPDADKDGRPDASDNCRDVANPGQVNSDGDALGDACDPDDDNDGLTDSVEQAKGTKRLDKDTDDDGLSDSREVNTTKTNPTKFDTDGDKLSDGLELGLTKGVSDPAGAALGTATSKFKADKDPATTTKPRKKDTDGDGLSDGSEDKNHNGKRNAGETDPLKKDSDGDGTGDKQDDFPLNKHRH
jgi:thrombospondin type 3 repeat protein